MSGGGAGTLFQAWCSAYDLRAEYVKPRSVRFARFTDKVPAGDRVCETCEGRATRAGLPATEFEPYIVLVKKINVESQGAA